MYQGIGQIIKYKCFEKWLVKIENVIFFFSKIEMKFQEGQGASSNGRTQHLVGHFFQTKNKIRMTIYKSTCILHFFFFNSFL